MLLFVEVGIRHFTKGSFLALVRGYEMESGNVVRILGLVGKERNEGLE